MSDVLKAVRVPQRHSFVERDMRLPSQYKVVMCNPVKAAATVYQIAILTDIFNFNNRQIKAAILEAHTSKKSVLFVGTREISEMRARQAEKMKQKYISKAGSLKKISFQFEIM